MLFWIIWVIDLALAILTFLGKEFRRSFTASDPTSWFDIMLVACIMISLVLRVFFNRQSWSLIIAGIPLFALLIWYMIDKATT